MIETTSVKRLVKLHHTHYAGPIGHQLQDDCRQHKHRATPEGPHHPDYMHPIWTLNLCVHCLKVCHFALSKYRRQLLRGTFAGPFCEHRWSWLISMWRSVTTSIQLACSASHLSSFCAVSSSSSLFTLTGRFQCVALWRYA